MPRRSQYAVVILAILVAFKLLDVAASTRSQSYNQFQQTAERAALLKVPNAVETWATKADEARTLSQEWNDHLWSGNTTGVIAATLQTELTQLLDARELSRVVIQVDPEAFDIPIGGQGIRFTLTARNARIDQILALLSDIAGYNRWIIIDDMNLIVTRSETGVLTASGVAPMTTSAAQTGGSS